LGKTGQTYQVIQRTDNSELPEIQQDWVKVDVNRQQGSSRDMRAKLSLLTLYLAIQCHMLNVVKYGGRGKPRFIRDQERQMVSSL
jgi:hypothetical protein